MIRQICLCLAFAIILSTPLMAQVLKPLPEALELDKKIFLEEQSTLVNKSFDDQPALNFKINIPSNFITKRDNQLKSVIEGEQSFGEVFHAYGPTVYDARPYITVQTFRLDRLISAKNWIISRVLENNYTLRGIEAGDNEETFDAFYVRLDSFGRSEAVRTRGFLHQDQLVLVEFSAPVELFNKAKDKQIRTIESFEFENDYDVLPPEDIVAYEFLESFSVKYPESWYLTRKAEEGINSHNVIFKTSDKNGFLLGTIDVSLISNRSLKDRVDKTIYPVDLMAVIKDKKQSLDDKNLSVGDIIERNDIKFLPYETDVAVTEVYPLMRKKSDVFVNDRVNSVVQEFWMTVIKTPHENGKNYVLTMIAPSRTVNIYNWSVAKRTYELMIESVR